MILERTTLNGPYIDVNGRRIRVKGYKPVVFEEDVMPEADTSWPITGDDDRVFSDVLPERDFVALVRVEKGDRDLYSIIHFAPTRFVADQLHREGETKGECRTFWMSANLDDPRWEGYRDGFHFLFGGGHVIALHPG